MDDRQEREVVADLRTDLEDGTWDERHGQLRSLDRLDVGLRLLLCEFGERTSQ